MTLQEKKEQLYKFVEEINNECKNIPTVEVEEDFIFQNPAVVYFNIKYINRSKEVYKRLLIFCADNNIIVRNSTISYLGSNDIDHVELYFID